MSLLKSLWEDESGSILCTEMVLLGTIGVIGATVGLKTLATSINAEMHEVSFAIRSLDQSYSYTGFKSAYACTAGSAYTQPCVQDSLVELKAYEDACIVDQNKAIEKLKLAEKKMAEEKNLNKGRTLAPAPQEAEVKK